MLRRHLTAAIAFLAGSVFAAGCGDEGNGGSGMLEIVATTAIAADVAAEIGGDDAVVAQLIPDSTSPHDFQASARDRREIEEADLLVEFGTGLEATVPDDAGAVFRFTEHAGELRETEHEEEPGADEHEGETGAEEHGEGSADPHIWMDPSRIATAVPALADAFAEADPGNAADFENRARRYGKRLRELDAEIASLADTVPPPSRRLVTSHEALGYFAERYGLEVVATPFGLSPEAEASANDLERVISAVEAEDVPVLFVEQGDDPQVLKRVADATGVNVVDDLLVEGFGPGAGGYVEMVRFTALRIFEALGSPDA